MKSMIQSFIIAFSMYSKIPMPKTIWEEKNMRYAMCFFPLVGAVIGALEYICFLITNEFHFSKMITTVILTVIPVFVTGGIHMDGFLDTIDALSSNQSRENKLKILSDPNSGAFAIIFCVVYFLITFSFWYEISTASILIVALGFVMSRSLSGISVVSFKKAKDTGLAYTFSNGAVIRPVIITNIVIFTASAVAMLVISYKPGLIAICASLLVFIYYRTKAYKIFGGITGDLCGYFLQLCELVLLICVVGGDLLWY